jgi:hypothetical protein
MTTVSKMGPTIAMGSAEAQDSKAKPVVSGQSRPEQLERGTKRHKGWLAISTPSAPTRGPNILKLHIRVSIERFPSRPFVWAGIESFGFSAILTQERHVKPLGQDLTEGALAPF